MRTRDNGGGRMAGGDLGQFDLRALQRVRDFTNDRVEWKRLSFVFKGYEQGHGGARRNQL